MDRMGSMVKRILGAGYFVRGGHTVAYGLWLIGSAIPCRQAVSSFRQDILQIPAGICNTGDDKNQPVPSQGCLLK
jgi:hypothetical protein